MRTTRREAGRRSATSHLPTFTNRYRVCVCVFFIHPGQYLCGNESVSDIKKRLSVLEPQQAEKQQLVFNRSSAGDFLQTVCTQAHKQRTATIFPSPLSTGRFTLLLMGNSAAGLHTNNTVYTQNRFYVLRMKYLLYRKVTKMSTELQ